MEVRVCLGGVGGGMAEFFGKCLPLFPFVALCLYPALLVALVPFANLVPSPAPAPRLLCAPFYCRFGVARRAGD